MKQKSLVPGLRLSVWLYGWLVKFHTPRFQADWGAQMLLDHEDAYRDTWNKEGSYGVITLWLRECADFVPDILKEYEELHLALLRREVSVREFLGAMAHVSSIILMLIAGGIAALFWVGLGASGVFHSGIEQSIWFIILFDGAIIVVGLLCLGFWKTIAAMIR